MLARCVLLLSLCLACCLYAWGGQESAAGYVSALQGEAYAVNADGLTRSLKIKDPVATDDYIVTEEKGRVQIIFQDNTVVTLGEKSRLKLTDFSWSKERNKGKFKVTVTEGLFRIIGGKITKTNPEAFVAKTPAASIGIRGSGYAGKVTGRKLEVFLLHGKGIDVKNAKGSVALLLPGMGTIVVDAQSPPTPPRHFNASEMYQIESGSDMGEQSGGSKIGANAVIVNEATITDSVNVAAGKDNNAQMGSIRVKESEVKGKVTNQAKIKKSTNVAAGSGNTAVMGSVNVE
ncbi:MAG: FecR family protein [Pseudomonadota bacterium]